MEPISTCEAFKYQWAIWRFTGMDPPKNPRLRILYFTKAAILNTFITLMFPISLTVNCFSSSNLGELCCSLSITVTDILCNLKLLNVVVKRKKLLEFKAINANLDRRANSKEERGILQNGIKLSHKVFFIFVTLYGLTVFASVLVVLLANEFNLMYPAWVPLDWENSKFSWILANGHQFLCLIIQGLQDCANDTYPPAYLTILTSHLKVLSFRLQNIAKDPRKSSAENYRELVECIKDHQQILKLNETIQEIISSACLAQFIGTGISQCTTAVYCLQMDFELARFATLIGFFSAVTLETYVLCHFGNVLMQESVQLTSAICSCNWTDQSKEFKTALLFLIHRSQKMNVIMAGGFIPVSIPIFVKVMKTSYSFFAVLIRFRK